MHVAVVDVRLMKLNYVWVVNLPQDFKLLLQLLHVLLDVGAENGLDSVADLRVLDAVGHTHGAEVSTSEWRLVEFIDLSNIIVAILALDVFEFAFARTRAPDRRDLTLPTRLLPLHRQ